MNILFCEHLDAESLASSDVHIYEVISHLSRMGHNITLLSGDYDPNRVGTLAYPQIPRWRRVETRLVQWSVLRSFRSELAMLGLLRHELYVFFSILITILRRRRIFDLIYRRHTQLNSEYLLAKLFNIPLVTEVNGIVADEAKITGQADKILLGMIDRIERFTIPKADKIIVVTSRLKVVLQEDYGVPGNKIVVVPNGANTDLFKPMDARKAREKLNLSQSNSYVCFVGALHVWSGLQHLVRSAPLVLQKCPNTRFLLVGDGAMRQELTSLAEQVQVLDKVIFAGMVPYQEVPLYINASDVCVFPGARHFRSDKTGGSPLKLHEYMACGKPVVAGNVEGDSDHVRDSHSGFVIDPTNTIEMARAIIALLENDQLRAEMGQRAREITVEKYTWKKAAEQVAEACQSVIRQ